MPYALTHIPQGRWKASKGHVANLAHRPHPVRRVTEHAPQDHAQAVPVR